jgi:hypothetical protein
MTLILGLTCLTTDHDEGCATSQRLKWDHFPPNKVCRVAQQVRKGEGKIEGIADIFGQMEEVKRCRSERLNTQDL